MKRGSVPLCVGAAYTRKGWHRNAVPAGPVARLIWHSLVDAKAVCRQLPQGGAPLAVRQKFASDHQARSPPYAGWRIVFADVGQEEEHQERPSAAFDVGPPFHEVGESPKLTSMCQSSSLANCGDGKRIGGSETQWGKPAPIADQLS